MTSARRDAERRVRRVASGTLVAAFLLWATPLLRTAAPPRSPSLQTLARVAAFSEKDLAAAAQGRVAVRSLDARDRLEVAAAGLTRVRTSRAAFTERVRDIVSFKRGELVSQVGRFSDPPVIEDLDGLTLERDDIEDLHSCRPGDCDVHMWSDGMRRLSAASFAADSRAEAIRVFKALLVEQLTRYRADGTDGLHGYEERRPAVALGTHTARVLDDSKVLRALAPEFHEYLRAFPRRTLDDVEHIFYWSKEKFGPKPVVALTHMAIYAPAGRDVTCIVSRQLYVTRYLDASIGITLLIDDAGQGPGLYLAYINRSRSPYLGGVIGFFVRPVVNSRTRTGLEQQILATRRKVEQRP